MVAAERRWQVGDPRRQRSWEAGEKAQEGGSGGGGHVYIYG